VKQYCLDRITACATGIGGDNAAGRASRPTESSTDLHYIRAVASGYRGGMV
jgi:hypothetical protein